MAAEADGLVCPPLLAMHTGRLRHGPATQPWRGRLVGRLYFAALAALMATCLSPATPARAQTERGVLFDIPAGPLDVSLATLSRDAGIQLLSDSAIVAGQAGNAVKGRMTVGEALTRILAGSRLRARFTEGGAIVIAPAATADMTLDALHVQVAPLRLQGPDPRLAAYVALVQRDIIASVRADPRLPAGAYRISLRIWLDPAGRIVRSDVIQGSGEPSQDAAFCAAVQKITVSQAPPDDLPEPLRIEFQVH
jgi:hypothetical protein